MKLSIAIAGLPNVGKSTLFNILTKQEVLAANYPFATIDPNVGIVPVPDERIDALADISRSEKKIPAVVEFYDIAGLVQGAHKGEGLGNQFLSHIRECQAIVVVLRAFGDPGVVHVAGSPDPVRDMDIILSELVLKDLETVEKRMKTAESEARGGGKDAKERLEAIKKVYETLSEGSLAFSFRDHPAVQEIQLLTAKPLLFLINGKPEEVPEKLTDKIGELGSGHLVMDLSASPDIGELIRKSYEILGLISFLTTGEKETRAWTIRKGALAPEAAGAIHGDFEKKFIRAEVVFWEELVKAGSWNAARQKGMLRLEGKEYEVQDGDVMVIRHG